MGLDLVELVIRFEDAFGIAIPDHVAEQLTTPRKVTDYIVSQVGTNEQPSCLTQQAFYFLRARFVPSLNISRKDFGPDTSLENLIPLEHRKRLWEDLRSQIGPAALPDLSRPLWLFWLLSLITVLVFTYAFIYSRVNFSVGADVSFLLGTLLAVAVAYGCAVLTRPLKRHFPRKQTCAGDLAKYLSLQSPHTFKKEKTGWTREQVAAVVRDIIIDQTAVEDFTEDSHFIDDMHLD